MVLSVKHTFNSPKADGTDSTLIQPSNWNAEHTITAAAGKVLGRDTSGNGSVQELPLAFDPTGQSMIPPQGTTAQRPASPATGMLRYNTSIGKFEQYNGTSWGSIGGGASISDSAPSNPQPGDLWWKSDQGQLYVYYNDGNSAQWVVANAFMGGTAFGDITVTSINAGPLAGNRNKFINGSMDIDQRRAGASASAGASSGYTYIVDRWRIYSGFATGGFTVQQSSVAPVGFAKSSLITVSTPEASITAAGLGSYEQAIEGFNTADLAWGTSSAKTVTLSFWVRCSVAGTYDLAFRNNFSLTNRAYVTTYTINSANMWEYKTITIPGDTTGSWSTDNNAGLYVIFSLGAGSNFFTGTTNAWQTGNVFGTSGSTKLVNSNGATLYFTGIQLEVGSQATPFERRNIQQELAMCQRYYYPSGFGYGYAINSTMVSMNYSLPVSMRTAPTITLINGTNALVRMGGPGESMTGLSSFTLQTSFAGINVTGTGFTATASYAALNPGAIAFSAEL